MVINFQDGRDSNRESSPNSTTIDYASLNGFGRNIITTHTEDIGIF